jgi:protease-4
VIADGRIVSAGQAQALGLVDRIGALEQTIELAKQEAGLSEARVIMYRRPDEYAESIYARAAAAPTIQLLNVDLGLLAPGPQFLYLWAPGAAFH